MKDIVTIDQIPVSNSLGVLTILTDRCLKLNVHFFIVRNGITKKGQAKWPGHSIWTTPLRG